MPFDLEDNTFLLAGPVKMHPRVLRAMSVPAMEHRAPLFVEKNKSIAAGLKAVFNTENDVALLTGSGTLGMDAALRCLLAKNDKTVSISNGKFGARLAAIADLYGGEQKHLTAVMGEGIAMSAITDAIAAHQPKVVTITHNETSSGYTFDLEAICKAAHDHGALVVADCITSVGGMPVPVDDWGVDVCIVGSQKCLGGPAGLVAVSASEAAQAAMSGDSAYYLSLPKYFKKFRDGDTPFTPAVPLHLGLAEAIAVLMEEGLEARYKRVAAQAQYVRGAMEALGLDLLVKEKDRRSDTVTAVRYPDGVSDKEFRTTLKEGYGVVVAGGQDDLKGKIFRVGTMGTVSWPEVYGGVAVVERVLGR